MDAAQAVQKIARELDLPVAGVRAASELLEEGNTIPFIARYRKEVTGSLDEIALRAIEDAWERAKQLAARKQTVLKSLSAQGQLTELLQRQIERCGDLQQLEEIYLPFKPKRRTRAAIAREHGLQPLADLLLEQRSLGASRAAVVAPFIAPEREVPDFEAALQGALDIVCEQWADSPEPRQWLQQLAQNQGSIASRLKRGKAQEPHKFEQYADYREPVRRVVSHRLLAMLRGEREGVLSVGLELDDARAMTELKTQLVRPQPYEFRQDMLLAVEDCYQRLLKPAIEGELLRQLKEQADDEAIGVFGKNLHNLLMAPPAGALVTLGIDPGFRTGCKLAVVDGTGKFLGHATVYPTPPRNDTQGAERTLMQLIQQHGIQLIAIGNGTASRETDDFVTQLLRNHSLAITKVVVSEAGASIYSASQLAVHEFPGLDVTVRGAISIARRLQDPLAELVKSDPKTIGVGQYQHDVNQAQLRKCLDRVVESCVNQVGVDLNMASASLLSYVAGIGPKLAEKIVEYRGQHGLFRNRRQLTQVPQLGKKAFEQAAGFLRIRDGEEPLDNSAVHPESYAVVDRMARRLNVSPRALVGNEALSHRLQPSDFVDASVGLPTVVDIIAELAKPGRDPRREFRAAHFDEGVNSLEDLKVGMVLEGVISNVTRFGAFVDIGVHQDALIHISQLSDGFVSDPSEIVAVGEVVRVRVLEVDVQRKRISVSRKLQPRGD